jgi:hypothetical protein
MSTDIQDLLQRAAPHAQRTLDVDALLRTARRRRWCRRVASSMSALVLIGGLVVGVVTLASGRQGGHVSVVARAPGDHPDAGVAVTLPAGWSDLPVARTSDPNEILVVGTAPRPPGEPINVCDTSTGSVYLSVYEYAPNNPFLFPNVASLPSSQATLTQASFQPRPAQFSGAGPGSFLFSCIKPTPGVLQRPDAAVYFFPFQASNRLLIAKIDARNDPTLQLMQSAIGVLNSLQVHPGH